MKVSNKKLSSTQMEELFKSLKLRFEKNKDRHKGIDWSKVQAKLESHPVKLRSLFEMEETGGEPLVVGFDKKTGPQVNWWPVLHFYILQINLS